MEWEGFCAWFGSGDAAPANRVSRQGVGGSAPACNVLRPQGLKDHPQLLNH